MKHEQEMYLLLNVFFKIRVGVYFEKLTGSSVVIAAIVTRLALLWATPATATLEVKLTQFHRHRSQEEALI